MTGNTLSNLTLCLMVITLNYAFSDVDNNRAKQPEADVWDTFLGTLKNRGLAVLDWEIEPTRQEILIAYFKTKIDMGVSNGRTSLPPMLMDYTSRLPQEMRQRLKKYATDALEADPRNGAAAKFLAVEAAPSSYDTPSDTAWHFLEKAATLVPNDVEVCYLAYEKAGIDSLYFDKAVLALERLFARHREGDSPSLYVWIHRICYDHFHVSTRPNEFYKGLENDAPLRERWKTVMGQIQTVLEERLTQKPEDWDAVRMLSEIHEALGNHEAVQAVLNTAQLVFEKRLAQAPKDWNALNGLVNIHERLGNHALAYEYKVKTDPTLAWVGQVLPDFPPTLDITGKPIRLADYRGKVVLLDFWAVWCGPCVGEIPNIKSVYAKYHDRGFEVIGVSLDEEESVLQEFISEHQLPWQHIFEGERWQGQLVRKYGVRGIPAPFLLDREGNVISVNARGDLLEELVATEIERSAE